jgi:hypothetical protein
VTTGERSCSRSPSEPPRSGWSGARRSRASRVTNPVTTDPAHPPVRTLTEWTRVPGKRPQATPDDAVDGELPGKRSVT